LFVGSNNMTAGGTVTNFEAALEVQLRRSDAEDETLRSSVTNWIEELIADVSVCLPLDSALLGALIADQRYRIADEDLPQFSTKALDSSDSIVDDSAGTKPGLFGKSKSKLRSIRAKTGNPLTQAGGGPLPSVQAHGMAPMPSSTVLRRWYKELKSSDAQQLGGTSRPTGHITLVKAGHPIDKRTYFRRDFFGSEKWVPDGPNNEKCIIAAYVVIRGTSLGTRQFTVQHTPAFEAGQGNRSTVLHWSSLSSHMRSVSHIDDYFTIEKLAGGQYRVTIASTETGPFLK
jgi:hypothetical protein